MSKTKIKDNWTQGSKFSLLVTDIFPNTTLPNRLSKVDRCKKCLHFWFLIYTNIWNGATKINLPWIHQTLRFLLQSDQFSLQLLFEVIRFAIQYTTSIHPQLKLYKLSNFNPVAMANNGVRWVFLNVYTILKMWLNKKNCTEFPKRHSSWYTCSSNYAYTKKCNGIK